MSSKGNFYIQTVDQKPTFEFAKLTPGEAHFYDLNGDEIEKQTTEIKWDAEAAEKGGFEHFMIAFCFSISIEMLQLLLRLGTFQLSDIFYNTVGGVIGGLVYYVAMKTRKRL